MCDVSKRRVRESKNSVRGRFTTASGGILSQHPLIHEILAREKNREDGEFPFTAAAQEYSKRFLQKRGKSPSAARKTTRRARLSADGQVLRRSEAQAHVEDKISPQATPLSVSARLVGPMSTAQEKAAFRLIISRPRICRRTALQFVNGTSALASGTLRPRQEILQEQAVRREG
jgi:hypothetical protein